MQVVRAALKHREIVGYDNIEGLEFICISYLEQIIISYLELIIISYLELMIISSKYDMIISSKYDMQMSSKPSILSYPTISLCFNALTTCII